MGDTEEANSDMMQRLQSSLGTSSSSILKQPLSMEQLSIPQLNPSLNRAHHFQQNFGGDSVSSISVLYSVFQASVVVKENKFDCSSS
ncbi:bZIP transcription factor 29-like [Fagus crenata]